MSNGHGVILITGGLGGLGLVTAEALVEAGARKLVLVSRSGKIKRDDQGLEGLWKPFVGSGKGAEVKSWKGLETTSALQARSH